MPATRRSILAALLAAHETHGALAGLPVPRLREQLDLPPGVIMRTLSDLIDEKLVKLARSQDHNLAAALTEAGLGSARQHQEAPLDAVRKTVE
jgi:hypothetical protein